MRFIFLQRRIYDILNANRSITVMNITIAIPVKDSEIFEHFGKATSFKFYKIENGEIAGSEIIKSGELGHDEAGLWLLTHNANAVICANIGPGAHGALTGAGILTFAGVSGNPDEAIEKFINGTLSTTDASTCQGHCSSHSHCCSSCHGCHR